MKTTAIPSTWTAGDLRIGDWLIQPQRNRITSAGADHHVEPKVMEVLLCLAEHPGAVVSRDNILARVWPDTVVVESTVFRAVSELRRIFADDPRQPRMIETVRKRGYRLLAPVESGEHLVTPETGGDTPRPTPRSPLRPRLPRSWLWRLALGVGLALALTAGATLRFRAVSPANDEKRPLAWPTAPRVVTSSPEVELAPDLSPDGRSLAFIRFREHGPKILVQHEGDTNPRLLNPDKYCEGSPAWSPDGRDIAFWRKAPGGEELALTAVLGGPPRVLLKSEFYPGRGISWSPDGCRLAVSWQPAAQGSRVIAVLDRVIPPRSPQGDAPRSPTEPRFLTTPPQDWFGDEDPVFSPDGTRLAFVRSSVAGHEQDIYVIAADGGEPRQVTFDRKPIRGLTWHPNGSHLIFASKRSYQYALWQLEVETGDLTWTGVADAREPAASRTGGTLAYLRGTRETNLWQADIETGTVSSEPLIRTTRSDFSPHFRPDGKAIVFSSDRTGHFEVWTCDADGGDCRQLTTFQEFTARPRFSPDGRRIAFHADIGGRLDIYVIDGVGRPPRQLTLDAASDQVLRGRPMAASSILPRYARAFGRSGRFRAAAARASRSPTAAVSWPAQPRTAVSSTSPRRANGDSGASPQRAAPKSGSSNASHI